MIGPVPISYIVPYRVEADDDGFLDLAPYLTSLATVVGDVVLVDDSDASVRAEHRSALPDAVRIAPPSIRTLNGKVGNVDTGVRSAQYNAVVIADDDVRYEVAQLRRMVDLLAEADVVRPHNYFAPLPWHARFDTVRTLLNRAFGGDWPGTLGVRRETYLRMGGYAGDVMFENYELVRTVRAHGGRERVVRDLLVRRRPPTTRHFWRQQVRQAYDEFARPARLVASLTLAPLVGVLLVAGHERIVLVGGASAILVAELGRVRSGGARVYPASSCLLAPVWLLWRSIFSWAALGAWARGGVRYRGQRIRRAASRRAQRSFVFATER